MFNVMIMNMEGVRFQNTIVCDISFILSIPYP